MKKLLTLSLAAVMLLSMVACGGKDKPTDNGNTAEFGSALEILETVWGTYGENEKFPVSGGDAENSTMDAPGKFGVADADILDNMLGVPAANAAMIDDAASLMHMMNANTFTAGAYHLANAGDLDAFVSATKENIMNRQWMCGFPDTLILVQVGDDYVVSAFGEASIIDGFKTKLVEAGGKVLVEESLAE